MARQSLTTPSLICVTAQLLPSTTATADCYIFSSLVQCNNTPTDLYLTLLSPQHKYHAQIPLPPAISTAAIKDAFRQPIDGNNTATHHFQLHEDKAAAAAAGHPTADAMLYVRKDRRDKRAWLTVPLPHNESHHRSDRLLQDLQKLFQRLQETVAHREADSDARAADIQHKLALLQHKVATKQAVEADMAHCTALLLKEKRDELARCETEYDAALTARRAARREKARKEREESRQAVPSEGLGEDEDETDSDGQTTSEDDEEESELSRLSEQMDDVGSDNDVMHEDGNELQMQPQQAEEEQDSTASVLSSAPRAAGAEEQNSDVSLQRNTSAHTVQHTEYKRAAGWMALTAPADCCCRCAYHLSARQLETVLSSSAQSNIVTTTPLTGLTHSPPAPRPTDTVAPYADDVPSSATVPSTAIVQPETSPPALAPK